MDLQKVCILKILRTVLLLLCIIICVFILSFSSQTGDTSAGISQKVTDVTVKIINNNKIIVNPNHDSAQYQSVHTFIRKTAHFSIYASLGFCLYGFLSTLRLKKLHQIFCTLIFCFLYACSDEFHQSFVFGRGPSFADVLIDSAGAFCGIAFMLLLIKLFSKINNKSLQIKSAK